MLAERSADRDRSAHGDSQRRLAEQFTEHLFRHFQGRQVGIDEEGFAAGSMAMDVEREAGGQPGLQMPGHHVDDMVGLLAGDQAAGDLDARFRRDDRLCALALITAGNAVEFQRRLQPLPDQQLAAGCDRVRLRRADFAVIGVGIEVRRFDRRDDPGIRRAGAVEIAFDRNASILAMQRRDQLATSALIGLGALPPWRPECRSLEAPVTVTSKATRPRLATVIDGRSGRHIAPSADITRSQPRRSR